MTERQAWARLATMARISRRSGMAADGAMPWGICDAIHNLPKLPRATRMRMLAAIARHGRRVRGPEYQASIQYIWWFEPSDYQKRYEFCRRQVARIDRAKRANR